MRIDGSVVLVTGAARRVGRAICLALGARGARLAVHYNRSQREAERLVAELSALGADADAFRADLSDPVRTTRLVGSVRQRFGALHVLVNNASIYGRSQPGRTSARDWDRHMDINVRAPFLLSQAAAPAMRQSGGGRIINLGDWAGSRPYVDRVPYCVSKAALLALNVALAKALAPEILVNAILPGAVLLPDGCPPSRRRAVVRAAPLRRLGSPVDVAEAAAYLIEHGDFITGAALPVDGGRLIA